MVQSQVGTLEEVGFNIYTLGKNKAHPQDIMKIISSLAILKIR